MTLTYCFLSYFESKILINIGSLESLCLELSFQISMNILFKAIYLVAGLIYSAGYGLMIHDLLIPQSNLSSGVTQGKPKNGSLRQLIPCMSKKLPNIAYKLSYLII